MVDNSSDMLSTHPPHIASELRVLISAGMQDLTGEGLCSAHHGLSLVVTARLGAQERTVLFDAGPDPYALERNVRRMERFACPTATSPSHCKGIEALHHYCTQRKCLTIQLI